MNSLARRIRSLPGRTPDVRPVSAETISAPIEHAASQLIITPGVGAGLSPLTSLVTSDGALIPATGPGGWDQLHAAGRIR